MGRFPHPPIVILTGAGVSAESGIPTFRGPDGLWEGHRVEEVATPEGYARNPERVQRFYNERRRRLQTGPQPNAAHRAIARLQREFPGPVTLVTQNIDDLHERGGSPEVIHMHGQLLEARCTRCGTVVRCEHDLRADTPCPACTGPHAGVLRPNVVWFGEIPLEMERIERALLACGLFIAIGTSGQVYPAAGFVALAARAGARTVECNLEPTGTSPWFATHLHGPATETVPALVERLLTGGTP